MPPKGLTVVVSGSHGPAGECRTTLEGWARAGLLRPFLWVATNSVREAKLITTTSITEVDVLTAVASEPFEVIRLVAIHIFGDEDPADQVGPSFVELQDLVSSALAPTQQLVRLNVVVSASGVTGIPDEILTSQVEANVVVAPEDRITEQHADRGVDVGVNLAPHAAHNVSTLGALWPRMDAAPFDGRRIQGSLDRPQVVVVRSFGRTARAPTLVEDVTSELLVRQRAVSWAATAVGGQPAREPAVIITGSVERFLSHYDGTLSAQAGPSRPIPEQETVGILSAFAMMFRYIFRGLRELPGAVRDRVAERGKQAIEGFAQQLTFGKDSTVAVRFRGRTTQSSGGDAARGAIDLATELLERAGRPSPTPPAVAEVWSSLRSLSFGLVDGGPMPSGFDPPMDGATREVITDPHLVGPDPEEPPFRLSSDELDAGSALPPIVFEPIRAGDPYQAHVVRTVLVEARDEARRPTATPGDDAEDTTVPDDALAARIDSAIGALDAWVARHSDSMLWRIGERIGAQLDRAESALMTALATIRRGGVDPDENAMRRARRKLHRKWSGWTVLILAIVAAAIVLDQRDVAWWEPDTFEWTIFATVTAVFWLIGLFITFIRYQREIFRIKHQFDRRHHAYVDALEVAPHHANQMIRLASYYAQYRDWVEIIGWMLHHPEGSHEPAEVDVENLQALEQPFAVRFADAVVYPPELRRASALVGRRIFGAGWLGELFADYERAAMEQLKYELGLPANTPPPDPDRDVAEPSPRAYLLAELETGRHAEEWVARIKQEAARELGTLPPEELFSEFAEPEGGAQRVTGFGGGNASPSEAYFTDICSRDGARSTDRLSPGIWTAEARLREAERVHRTSLWGPAALRRGTTDIEAWHDLTAGDAGDSTVLTLSVLRMDETEPCSFEDLAIFEGRERTDASPDAIDPKDVG